MGKSFIIIVIAIICGCVVSWLLNWQKTNILSVKFFSRTLNDSIWDDVIDYKNGSVLKVHLKGKPYFIFGTLSHLEEHGEDSWISINKYAKYKEEPRGEEDELFGNEVSYDTEKDYHIVIRLSDVDHIEVFNFGDGKEQEENP